MTPEETMLLIEGWNEAQGSDKPAAPTRAEVEELERRYG